MLDFYRIDHICQVVADLEPQVRLLEGLFGFVKSQEWENGEEGIRGVLLDIPGSWGQRWEIQAPLGEDSPLLAFLESPVGPGIHHLAVEVPDLDAARKQLEGLGIEPSRCAIGPSGRYIDVPFVPSEIQTGLLWRLYGPASAGWCCNGGNPVHVKAFTPSGPEMGIRSIDQVGHACADREQLADWCERAVGMREVYRTPEGKHPDIATLILNIPGTQMRWELIQPVDEESFVHRYVTTRGHFAHHVTFQVENWEAALAACEHHEVPTFGANKGVTDGGGWADTFIHPKYTGGFLVQFFWEERPGIWSRSDKVAARAGHATGMDR